MTPWLEPPTLAAKATAAVAAETTNPETMTVEGLIAMRCFHKSASMTTTTQTSVIWERKNASSIWVFAESLNARRLGLRNESDPQLQNKAAPTSMDVGIRYLTVFNVAPLF